jgi:hypothetical protein
MGFAVAGREYGCLLSQLAQTAEQERALLEECGDLLSVSATLEVKYHALDI